MEPAHGSSPPPPAWWRQPADAFWASGISCALGSSLCFALAGTFVKALQNRIPVFEIVVVRAIVSAAVTSLSCRANGIPLFGRTAPQALLIARGVVGGTAMTASYEALVRLPLADSTVIFYLCPALTAILCWLVLGEAVGWLTAAGCAASLAGVVLVAQPPWLLGGGARWSHARMLGTVFGVCGAVLAAGAYLCIRMIGKREHPLTVAMYFHCFAFLSAAIPLACGYPEPAVAPTLPQALLLLAIACGSFGGNLLVNRAFQLEPGARASAINFSQVPLSYFIGTVFFGDRITLLGLAGTALIASGVTATSIEKARRAKAGAAQADVGSEPPGGGPGLPQEHRYQPLGHPAPPSGLAGWWRRLWGGTKPAADAPADEEQLPAELPQLQPDYRGRFKAKHSGRELAPREAELALQAVNSTAAGNGGGGGGRASRA